MNRHGEMARFWDRRAAEDAFFYVDNRLNFGDPDQDRFWSKGEEDLDTVLALAGASLLGDDQVVEIGCGLGRLTRVLAARANTVRAIDVSAEMLRRAKELNPALDNVTWMHGDGTSLAAVEDRSADVCVSHVVFQHIPDPEITLGYVREMGRVLRPNGWAAFQVSNDERVHSRTARQKWADRFGSWLSHRPRGVANKHWLGSAVSIEALKATAESAGLDVEHIHGAGSQYCVVRLRRRIG
jgi:SAM-dependent methyltransferase